MNAQNVSIQLLNTLDRTPVPNAHILDTDNKVISISDEMGFFELSESDLQYQIQIRALGFQTLLKKVNKGTKFVLLTPIVLDMQTELIVEGSGEQAFDIQSYNQSSSATMDEFISKVDGVNTIQRGAFAWEPMIRGQSDQRLILSIDGMQVFKACVDKMDPITSYVEPNNLKKLSIDKNGGDVAENGSGLVALNLITERASFQPLKVELESRYQVRNNFQTYRLSASGSDRSSKNAYRVTGSYKSSDNLVAGNNETVANTQFEKLNLNLSYIRSLSNRLSLEANYITDKAYDVGYPALLMDATQALADIARIQLNISEAHSKTSVRSIVGYWNKIRHTMDDYERDVSQRAVMRNMYMPMYGETETFGLKLQGNLPFLGANHTWFFDAYSSRTYGDMEMISLDPSIADMFIFNLKDVQTYQFSLGLKQNKLLHEKVNLKLEENIRIQNLTSKDESYLSFFEGIYRREFSSKPVLLLSGSATLLYMATDHFSIKNTSVYTERDGNHLEQFGHYVYNYVDGFFYDGNPWLKPEKSIHSEIQTIWSKNNQSISLSMFMKYYWNYIDGTISESDGALNVQFKQYANVGNVRMSGLEIRTINPFFSSFTLENRASYVFAQNITVGDPLPLIPPFHGQSTINFTKKEHRVSFIIDWATSQKRIASITSVEDETPGFIILGLNYTRSWFNDRFESELAIKNLTDQYYHEHTSIGNIPQQGLNAMLSLRYNFSR